MKTMLNYLCVCLGMLALSAPASAQKQECFAVVMTNNPGAGALGSILVDKCTGNTWLLIRAQTANGATANRWFPITVEKSEAITSNPPSVR